MSDSLVQKLAAAIRAEEAAQAEGGARLRDARKARIAAEWAIERSGSGMPEVARQGLHNRVHGGKATKSDRQAHKALMDRTAQPARAADGRILSAPERHGRRIAREDARMPQAMRDVLSPPTRSVGATTVLPPVSYFKSPKGRPFTIREGSVIEGRWGREETWPILYQGKAAGKLFRNFSYGGGPHGTGRWQATTRELFWTHDASGLKRGGYDVAAFDTVGECLRAWGFSADQILDFHATQRRTT